MSSLYSFYVWWFSLWEAPRPLIVGLPVEYLSVLGPPTLLPTLPQDSSSSIYYLGVGFCICFQLAAVWHLSKAWCVRLLSANITVSVIGSCLWMGLNIGQSFSPSLLYLWPCIPCSKDTFWVGGFICESLFSFFHWDSCLAVTSGSILHTARSLS